MFFIKIYIKKQAILCGELLLKEKCKFFSRKFYPQRLIDGRNIVVFHGTLLLPTCFFSCTNQNEFVRGQSVSMAMVRRQSQKQRHRSSWFNETLFVCILIMNYRKLQHFGIQNIDSGEKRPYAGCGSAIKYRRYRGRKWNREIWKWNNLEKKVWELIGKVACGGRR